MPKFGRNHSSICSKRGLRSLSAVRETPRFVKGPILILVLTLCSCSGTKSSEPVKPPTAHLVTSDGTPVSGAPEPEVVRLIKIESVGEEKHVTVGNVDGRYVLVCNEETNDEHHAIKSCLTPRPQRDYLLFKSNTKWLVAGATEPMTLSFMQDYTVSYNRAENIGLMSSQKSDNEGFGVYWLLSWTANSSVQQ